MKNTKKNAAEEAVKEAAAAGEETAGRVAELEEALQAKEAEAAANWEKFLRERADLENMKKRLQREKEELLKYGNENLLLEILPVVDSLERALTHTSEGGNDAVTEGVRMTLSMLAASLKKFGVTPLDAPAGTPFDPSLHQAMAQVPTEEMEPNRVVQEFQKGYLLNDRLLRPAMVSVAAKKAE